MKTLHVNLPGARYPIHIGAGILDDSLRESIEKIGCDRVAVVSNPTLQKLYPHRIETALEGLNIRVDTILVPDGEQYKSLETLSTIYDRLLELEANRKTALIAFGGGVVGDMAGFAAATFMRGTPLVQVPTTLLAQVDSSVGGKTAVNHALGKNAIGAFKQPDAVVMDLTMLATLPEREVRAGLFELIKHGMIRDLALFEFLEDHRNEFPLRNWEFWEEAIYRSCQVKAAVVEEDEQEAGLRAILNFGHSLGHLIETHTGYTAYLHGEAVGVGMLFASYVSREMDLLPDRGWERIRAILEPLATRVELPTLAREGFFQLLMHDKKASGNTLKFILLRTLGEAFIREKTPPADLWPHFQAFLGEMPETICLQTS